jgi:hypothetical protein
MHADTICFCIVGGGKVPVGFEVVSKLRRASAFMPDGLAFLPAKIAANNAPAGHDTISCEFYFVNAETGEVLWQYQVATDGDPLRPVGAGKPFMNSVLRNLPRVTELMDKRYQLRPIRHSR